MASTLHLFLQFGHETSFLMVIDVEVDETFSDNVSRENTKGSTCI